MGSICEGKLKPSKDDIKALGIYHELRNSNKVCCLSIYSDYWYCWEVRWSCPEFDGHKKHTSGCCDDLLEAMLKAKKEIDKVTIGE